MSEITAEQYLSISSELGEGPIWDARLDAWWWVDILGKKLCRLTPGDGQPKNESWDVGQMVGTVVSRSSGGVMLAVADGFAEFDIDLGKLTVVADPESDMPGNRFNDGKCDPAGRFWAGTMRIDESSNSGSLYSLDAKHNVTKRLGNDIGVSNGIVWSSDSKRMYFIDSPVRRIYGFDFELATGEILNQSIVMQTPEELGYPDGMAIDESDKLWVAFWGGWCVAQICPTDGKLLSKISVPVEKVTACSFGGAKLDELLITTASVGLSAEQKSQQPQAGDLFIAKPGVRGTTFAAYAG